MSEEFLQNTPNTNDNNEENLPQMYNSEELSNLEELIAELPKKDQKIFRELIFAFEERTSWQGPIPPPEILKGYNEAISDGAERIFRMAERKLQVAIKLADHDMEMEKMIVPKRERREDRGMNYAFLISLALLIISAILIWQGHDLAGTAPGTVDIIGLATVFIIGRRKANQDLE